MHVCTVRMVSWENIFSAISANKNNSFYIRDIVSASVVPVDRFPIQQENCIQTHETKANIQPANISMKPPEMIKRSTREIDPLVIDLADTVELYDSASWQMKKQMECAEALRIEGLLHEIYKSQSGRSRGWTKVGLEALLQPRCASGGDIKELEKSKKAFPWPLVGDDKVYSAFLDFLCLAKQIKIAVWFEEEKHVILYPAADMIPEKPTKLYNITNKGLVLNNGIHSGADLLQYCETKQWVLMPPNSVFHTLSTLSLTEMDSIAKKCGITVDGSKKERVAKLAVFKLRSRLQKVEATLT